MITTHSKFLYGFEVLTESKWIDFDDGTSLFAVNIQTGSKTPDDLIFEIETAMNEVGSNVIFTVSYNRSTRIFTISGDGAFDLLVDSGANAENGIYPVLGIAVASDFMGVTSVTGSTAVGSSYATQFKLQDYVPSLHNKSQRFAKVNKAASGKTTLVTFGTDEIFEMSFKWLTDRAQPSGGPIRNGTIASFLAFLDHATSKKPFEFYPDENDTSVYYKVILDNSGEGGDGTAYRLNPKYGANLMGYYDTGVMKMRVIE